MLRFNAAQQLPEFHDGNAWRSLGRIQTDKPKLAVAPFSDYLDEHYGLPVSPELLIESIPDYDRYQSGVPILDQGQVGSCVGHAHTTMIMKVRDLAGCQFVALSADSLYAQINNDRDQGSDPADAITALEKTGVCTLADVPDNFVLWRNISDAAKANAARFKIAAAAVYKCSSFAEMIAADYLGFAVTLTINVGNNFNPDASGIVGFAPGAANHSVSGGEAKKTINGQPAYRFRNSWTTGWGDSGYAWCTARHIDAQPYVELFATRWALLDPQDPTNPPL